MTDKRDPVFTTLLETIDKPLRFAAANNYAHLAKVKGLDSLIPELTAQAAARAPDTSVREALQHIGRSFSTFSVLTEEQQRSAIRDARAQLIALCASASSRPTTRPPASDFSETLAMFEQPVHSLHGIGTKTAALLERLQVTTIEDLLLLLPRSYIDYRTVTPIGRLQPGNHAVIRGTVTSLSVQQRSRRGRLLEILIHDNTGAIAAKWFRIPHPFLAALKNKFKPGSPVLVTGRLSEFRFRLEMHHPDIELAEDTGPAAPSPGIVPVYPLTEGLHQAFLQKAIRSLLQRRGACIADYLPDRFRTAHRLAPLGESLTNVHTPGPDADIRRLLQYTSDWHRRIIFDELFLLQVLLALRKRGTAIDAGIAFTASQPDIEASIGHLPFTLTPAQSRSFDDIVRDMRSPHPMNRLLQGDVGSGKTVIALLAARIAAADGYQTALMAPTEILAEQHYATICELLAEGEHAPILLTGSLSRSQRTDALKRIEDGSAKIIVGTHALIQDEVRFERLGLAVIDEQHRFGVLQRARLRRKGQHPDTLVMTATPIPRSLGLTVYGDLDISIIDELPPGRKPVITRVYGENGRAAVYEQVRDVISRGRQVFIVYPLVEESDRIDLMDASRMSLHLKHDIFPEARIGLIHGRLSPSEKDALMTEFKQGRLDIMVATTVIEVGIDVPNASLMIVEHAERFGLSQLHQLRGRVGRGATQACCILLAQFNRSDEARKRLQIMEDTSDGFKIAEADFDIRGPGDFLGTRQSGLPDFRVAHIGRDLSILAEARAAAFNLVAEDPDLGRPEHAALRDYLLHRWKGNLELAGI